jgi:hypothetical protein
MEPSAMTALHLRLGLVASLILAPSISNGQELAFGPLPYPVVSSDTWVLIEIWPEASDITLSAYFMDKPEGKNRNLCEATKRALDRDAAAFAKETQRQPTSFRQCMPLAEAIHKGYIASAGQ